MGQIIRCPLIGAPCMRPITIQEKTFFLAEAEEPEYDKKHRRIAINEAIADGYKIRSALDEKGINAFTCKICEMIQTCAYGIADITQNNANVLLELGMMLALGKPTIILSKKGQEQQLKLPSDVIAIEIIPFEEYLDIVDQLREVVRKLPPPVSPPSPIEDIEKLQPQFARQLRKQLDEVVEEFKKSVEEAKLDTISVSEEKKKISPELGERLTRLEEKLEDMRRLGFVTDVRTAFLRGNYFYNQGKYDEALADYNRSLELRPDNPAILNNRGRTYDELGRYDEALADYNRSLELKPDDPVTLNNRGITYHKLKRYDEALADYNRSLELRPDNPITLNNRGSTYDELGRYDEALADYNRSLELRPDNLTTLNNRGSTYAKLGRYDEALADYNRSLELRPDYPSAIYNLACIFSLWGKTDDALAYLEKAIKMDKKYREMAKTDKDFDNIRDDPRFKKLVEPE
jgi:tetratricopeptide (TPR) repeat protein